MWCVAQIGAREHYAVARALLNEQRLATLLTDAWVRPWVADALRWGGKERLAGRGHADVPMRCVRSFTGSLLAFEIAHRTSGWDHIIARNEWFQDRVIAWLEKHGASLEHGATPPVLFAYSYAAKRIFEWARERGWATILGQIDPGPEEDALVRRLQEAYPEWAAPSGASPPQTYWDAWRAECALADQIVVNSSWSKRLLEKGGVDVTRCSVVPLAYEAPARQTRPSFPTAFSPERPLRVLFLGQVIVRKGIQDLVAAAELLTQAPVHFDVVGSFARRPDHLPGNVTLHGAVPRSEAAGRYARARVFVLPTHSDGFAITQLEAMAHGLPVIATPRCGDVVEDGKNGWIVPAGEPAALAARIEGILAAPASLAAMAASAQSRVQAFGVDVLGRRLRTLEASLAER